jgi:hypothetical protein
MRSWPTVNFTKTDTLDDSDLQKLVTRMMELGILTPEQGIKTIKTGSFPEQEELLDAQKDYKDQREDGYYMPIVNSINLHEKEAKEEQQKFVNKLALQGQKIAEKSSIQKVATPSDNLTGTKPENKKSVSAPSGGRPLGTSNASFSKKNIIETTKLVSEFELKAFASFAEKYGIERAERDRELISRVSESIIVGKENGEWGETLANIVEDFDKLSELNVTPEILNVGAKHGLDDLAAAILYHSSVISV